MISRILFYGSALICGYILWPMAVPILIGITLAYASEELMEKILKNLPVKTEVRRYVAVGVLALLTMTLIAVPIAVLIGSAIRDAAFFLSEAHLAEFLQEKTGSSDIRNAIALWASNKLDAHGLAFSIQEIADTVNSGILALSKSAASVLTSAVAETPKLVFHLTMIFFTWVIFTVNGRELRNRFLPVLIPFNRERQVLCEITGNIVRGLIVSTFLVAIVQAVLATTVLALCNVPRAAALGVMAFIASFIPLIGTGIIMIPSAIYLAGQDQLIAAAIVAGSTFAIGITDNLLRPLLLKNAVDLNIFWLFLALIGGLSQFGITGTLIGPLFFALFLAFSQTLETLKEDARN